MSSKEIKQEIQKVLDNTPDAILPDILEYLKMIQSRFEDPEQLSQDLRRIIAEDKSLLALLVQ